MEVSDTYLHLATRERRTIVDASIEEDANRCPDDFKMYDGE